MFQTAIHLQRGLYTPLQLLWVQCSAPEILVAPPGPGHVRAQPRLESLQLAFCNWHDDSCVVAAQSDNQATAKLVQASAQCFLRQTRLLGC